MDFNGHLNDIKGLLQDKYPTIDFGGDDYEVANKLNSLVWIIARRINDPAPPKEERVKRTDVDDEWRKFE